ncbi:5-oxoprolinase subunit C family protein [Dermatophilus congolensis]|uniref:5-oxoprolinase subunit C family protein n=1 Tax=Dermatophilus congolensis TaxID=1863 RepID=UPI0038B39479
MNNTPAPTDTPIYAPTNSTIHLGTPTHGLRTYLAINGGIHAPTTLGSTSTNPTAGIGPAPLTAGTHLTLNPPTGTPTWNTPPDVTHARGTPHTARVILGPRDNWFTSHAITTLFTTTWTTTPNLDRIGIRLTGAQLQRTHTKELPSEGTIRGAIQIPPNGEPVIFLADHPATGGYPVIGVINDTDTDTLAQARPGDTIRFTPQPPPFPRDIL